jgi:hypothetical protein
MSEDKNGAPTDDALDEALQKATESKPTEEGTPSETETEAKSEVDLQKEINDLKAEIGRGGKALNEVSALKDEISSLKAMLEDSATQKQTEQEAEAIVTTEADVRTAFQKFQSEQAQEQKRYEDNYFNHIAKLASADKMDDVQLLELENTLKSVTTSETNFRDSAIDAKINYLKAKMIMQEKGGKLNLKGDTPKGTGIGSATDNQTKDPVAPKLDAYAQEYAEATGMKPEEVAKALKGL